MTTPQSFQPAATPTITQEINPNARGQAILIEPHLSQETSRLPTERPSVPEEERPGEEIVSVIGPDTLVVVMDPAIGILRIQQVGASTQTLAPPSESIIPPRIPDNITIALANPSAPSYEPVSQRSSGMGLPPARTQETSIVPQLDGTRSLPTVHPTQERMGRLPDQMRQDLSQGGTHVQTTVVNRRKEYLEEGDNGDEYRRPCHGQWPADKGQACLPQEDQVGGFPTNSLVEWDPLMEEDPLEEEPWWRTP